MIRRSVNFGPVNTVFLVDNLSLFSWAGVKLSLNGFRPTSFDVMISSVSSGTDWVKNSNLRATGMVFLMIVLLVRRYCK